MKQASTLLVTMGGLGDAILFSPVIRAASGCAESSPLTLLAASSLVKAAYAGSPGITGIAVVDTNRRYAPRTYWRLLKLGLGLRRRGPVKHAVFASRMNPRLCMLIARVVGARQVFTMPRPDDALTDLEVNLRLARRFLADASKEDVFVPVSEQARQEATAALDVCCGSDTGRFLALYPSVARPDRPRWPLADLVLAARRILQEQGLERAVVLGGGQEEREWTEQVGTDPLFANLAGKLSISATAALLEHAALAVCNDGGIMHLAGAMRCPLVGIMPNVSRHHSPPGPAVRVLQPGRLSCHPCHPRRPTWCHEPAECVRRITVDAVVAAARDVLAATPR